MTEREFDVVVLGASGVTGRQVVRYLAERSASSTMPRRWAVAGRDAASMQQVLEEFGAEVPVVLADLEQAETIAQLASRTTVLANLVGPYARYGRPVYEACAAAGTHQVDVCGEVDWLHQQMFDMHRSAQASGASLVTTSGFEALPFDLLALRAARYSARTLGSPLADIDIAIAVTRDPPILTPVDLVSGGTMVSGLDAIRRGNSSAAGDARLLDPRPHEALAFDLSARQHRSTGEWIGPMVPSPYINPVVAHRTAALLSRSHPGLFAPNYRFRDGLVSADLFPIVPPALAATWLTGTQLAGALLSAAPPAIRGLVADTMQAFGPKPGAGPDESRLAGWSWVITAAATAADGNQFTMAVSGEGHPGYRSTANMVGEAALLLAESDATIHPGLVTPAVAFAERSLEDFAVAGVTVAPL